MPKSNYPNPKYDPEKLKQLIELREETRFTKQGLLSRQDAARYFRVNRNDFSNWETGMSRPHRKRRNRFILYFLDRLGLRQNPARFFSLWEDIMEGEWEWESLSMEDLSEYPSVARLLKEFVFLAPPKSFGSLVGRDNFIYDLKRKLLNNTNLVMTGLPGVGKTALIMELANDSDILKHFKNGVLWARLGQEADVLDGLGQWEHALKISSKQATIEKRVDIISAAINNRRMLLVLDDAWETQTAETFWLPGPYCACVVTTRVPEIAQNLSNCTVIPIEELNQVDGLNLLAELAPKAVEAAPTEAKELVEAVGGLPLGLILMGNYLKNQSHGGQLRRIRQALARLHLTEERMSINKPQSFIQRHPSLPADTPISLNAVIAISDETLDDAAQRSLRALSLFPPKPNSFSEEAALAISNQPVEAIDTLSDYGLLESSGSGRYTLHQTISDYARQKIEDEVVYKQMVKFFLNYVKKYEKDYSKLDLESRNILAAFHFAFDRKMHETYLQGVIRYSTFQIARGQYETAKVHLNQAQEIARKKDDVSDLTTVLNKLATIEREVGNYPQAKEHLQECLKLIQDINNIEQKAIIYNAMGDLAIRIREYSQAEKYLQEGLELARQSENPMLIARVMHSLGKLAGYRSDFSTATKYFQNSLDLSNQSDDWELISSLKTSLSLALTQLGNYPEAERYLQQNLKLVKEKGHKEQIIRGLTNLGVVSDRRGTFQESIGYYQEALDLARELGHRPDMAGLLVNLGSVHEEQGNYEQAKAYHLEGLTLSQKIGDKLIIIRSRINLGILARKQEDYSDARDHLQQALAIARELSNPLLISVSLKELGEVYLRTDELSKAEKAFIQARDAAKQPQSREWEALSLYGLVQIAKARNDMDQACHLGREALAILEDIGHHMADEVRQFLQKNCGFS